MYEEVTQMERRNSISNFNNMMVPKRPNSKGNNKITKKLLKFHKKKNIQKANNLKTNEKPNKKIKIKETQLNKKPQKTSYKQRRVQMPSWADKQEKE